MTKKSHYVHVLVILISVFGILACKQHQTTTSSSVDLPVGSTSWEVVESISEEEPIRWMTKERSYLFASSEISWIRDKDSTALELLWKSNETFSSVRPEGALTEWMLSKDPNCNKRKPFFVAENVWVGISQPFVEKGTTFVSCSMHENRFYEVAPDVWFSCGWQYVGFRLKYQVGSNAYSSDFDIAQRLQDFFFLPYERESRDWTFTSKEEASNIENPEEVVKQHYPDVVYYSDDIGEPHRWSLIVATEDNQVDKVSFDYIPHRLHRRSVPEPGVKSKWYRQEGNWAMRTSYIILQVEHIEPIDLNLDMPKTPLSPDSIDVNHPCYLNK